MGEAPTPPADRPSKLVAFRAFLQEGWVSVHLDARHPDVVLPPELAGTPHLVLQYGLNMPIPIPDLEVTELGISATLSFSRQPHRTKIPWSAVYIVACEDGRGVLYHEDVPPEVALVTRSAEEEAAAEAKGGDGAGAAADGDGASGATSPDAAGEVRDRRGLRSIPLEEVPEPADENDTPPEEAGKPRRRRRPQLKLVK
jgi:stringent starvation protein B